MRFIIGFIFFGLLFYAIWYFFPDAFQTMASWAGNLFNFIKTSSNELYDKFKASKETAPDKETTKAALFLLSFFFLKVKK